MYTLFPAGDESRQRNSVEVISKRTRNLLFSCLFFFPSLFVICWWQLCPVKQQSPDITYLSKERKVIARDEVNRCELYPGNRTSGQTSASSERVVQKLNRERVKLHFQFNRAGIF